MPRAGCRPHRSTPPARRRWSRYCPAPSPRPALRKLSRPDSAWSRSASPAPHLPENGLTSAVGGASTKRVSQPSASTSQRMPSSPKSSAPDARRAPMAQSMAIRYGNRLLATSKPSFAPSTNASYTGTLRSAPTTRKAMIRAEQGQVAQQRGQRRQRGGRQPCQQGHESAEQQRAGNEIGQHHRVPQAQALHQRHRQQARQGRRHWWPAESAGTPGSGHPRPAARGT